MTNPDTVICKEVIISTIRRRGTGVKYSPIRIITEVFEKDGELIAEYDPSPEGYATFDLIHFAIWCTRNRLAPDNINPDCVSGWLNEIGVDKTK